MKARRPSEPKFFCDTPRQRCYYLLMCGWVDDERTLEETSSEGEMLSSHDDLHLVYECDRPLAGSARQCLDDIDEVIFRRGGARSFELETLSGARRLTVDVPDARMSAWHARMRRVETGWVLEDIDARSQASGEGRVVGRASLTDGSTFELGHTHFMLRSRPLSKTLPAPQTDASLPISTDPTLTTLNHECGALFARLVSAARTGVPVLLIGEAGSGKDALARALHLEARRRGEFIALDCRDLGRGLRAERAGDDLLPHLALDFKRAAGGTLYLNEIEELSPVAQLALLAILKSGPKPGGATVISSVRSNHDLRPEVPRIRADLLGRLAGFTMPLPPLRERREDLGTFVAQILGRLGAAAPERIRMDPTMGQALLLHVWPYNITELETCVRTAVALSADDCIRWSPATLFPLRTPMVLETPRNETIAPQRADRDAQTEPDPAFAHEVRRALKCNLSVTGLQKNGLLRSRMVIEATKGSTETTETVSALRDIFLSAIDAMAHASPRGEKQSRVLQLTFIKPTATQQEAADRLAMAFGTYRRYVTSALVELTSVLWFNELSARLRDERNPGAAAEEADDGAISERVFRRLG